MGNGTGSGEWKGRMESGTWGIGNGNMKWEIENGNFFFSAWDVLFECSLVRLYEKQIFPFVCRSVTNKRRSFSLN